jgi:hypothetical protein
MKTAIAVTTLFALTAAAFAALPSGSKTPSAPAPAHPLAIAPAAPSIPAAASALAAAHPKVEVVFVLDTTGSMSGLLQGAKENIWSIARSMSQAQPTPELKVGLVAFRDRGDDYVTRVTDLSTDLDSMYATLMDFQAAGGGDGPESVNQALNDAVQKISWSQDPSSYKVIFLVGDAPPHMDYQDDVKYPQTLKIATARGIVVNTIQAGDAPDTRDEWKHIASLNQGAFFRVDQGGGALAVNTPYDDKIATLSRDLDATRLYYGDAEKQKEAASKVAATDKLYGGSVAAQAKRALFNSSAAGASNAIGKNDLVDEVSKGKVNLAEVDREELPAALRDVDVKERERVVKDTAEKRSKLQAQIADLGLQRQAFVANELKSRKDAPVSLDDQIYATVKTQGAKKGLTYSDEAAH